MAKQSTKENTKLSDKALKLVERLEECRKAIASIEDP